MFVAETRNPLFIVVQEPFAFTTFTSLPLDPRFASGSKKHGIVIETPTEARQAERGPSVLSLQIISLILALIGMAAVWYLFFRT
jgi:hypothetical protein